jgi:predicted flavoprotein YhiN
MTYDVIVTGGGSAGLMASIVASMDGAKVLLVDKGDKLGRKLIHNQDSRFYTPIRQLL